eukprot:8564926-Pyramimonas_sp.AAC.1
MAPRRTRQSSQKAPTDFASFWEIRPASGWPQDVSKTGQTGPTYGTTDFAHFCKIRPASS